MGRRRAWLIAAQVLMSAGFLAAAVLAPGPTDIDVLLVVTFLVMAGGATQDVAVDGLAVDILPEKEQGTASAFMFGGQATGGALAAASAAAGLQYLGSATTFLLFIPFLLIPTIYAIILRERPGERRFPWSEGQTAAINRERVAEDWLEIFRVTFKSLFRGPSLLFVAAQSLQRTSGGMTVPMFPLLATVYVGLDETTYGSLVSTSDLITAIIGIGVGSVLTARLGARIATVAVSIAFIGALTFLLLGQSVWAANTSNFILTYGTFGLVTLLFSACTNPLRMQLCDPRVSATQFTIYNSISNLPVSIGATLFAMLGGVENLPRPLMVAMGITLGSMILFAVLRMPKGTHEVPTTGEFEEALQPRVE
jgi:MFS transporter, PAT family, beta-lactamase induction signal transducer AmpG